MLKTLGYIRALYAWRIQRSTEVGYAPQDISVELTNTCNFRCSFCPQSDPEHTKIVPRSALSPDRADIILAKLREGGVTTDVIHWTLDGEPFVNKQIDEISGLAIKRGWRHFIFATNGFYCTPDRLAKMPAGASYQLCIDFCADKAMFEKHRGTPNSWEKVKGNIDYILGSKTLDHISLQITDISSFSVSDRNELVQRFAALKACFPTSPRIKIKSRVFHNATGHVEGILESKKGKAPAYNLCPYPWTSFVVASNGDVVACCRDLQHKTVLGNLFNEDLKSIWNGGKFKTFRKALADQDPQAIRACANCDMPYDQSKFTINHIVRTGLNRLGVLK
jgi:radical SAM protein with 4Fe4S-binding SPASM domain